MKSRRRVAREPDGIQFYGRAFGDVEGVHLKERLHINNRLEILPGAC
jgi:hypothetical protein